MSAPPDRGFSETEKVVLLAEIIKSSNIPSAALLHLIIAYQVEPEWIEIQRPPGRLLRDCQRAFADLRSAPGPSPYPLQDPRSDPATLAAYQQRATYAEGSSIGRSIVPRPQGMPPGVYAAPSPFAAPPAAEPPRKRGRPSNADLEARRQRAEAMGEPYPPTSSRARQRNKTTSRLSIPPSTPMTPTQSEPGTAVTTSTTTTSPKTKALPPSRPAGNESSASPAPSVSESTKRPLPPDDTPTDERQPEGPDLRRPPDPPARGPRFPSADVVPQPWSATRAPAPPIYPSRSLPPPGSMPLSAAPHMEPHLQPHHHSSGPSTPQRNPSPPRQPSSH